MQLVGVHAHATCCQPCADGCAPHTIAVLLEDSQPLPMGIPLAGHLLRFQLFRCDADGCAAPTIAVLYEDTKEQRHVKTYEVSLRDKVRGRWACWRAHAVCAALLCALACLARCVHGANC